MSAPDVMGEYSSEYRRIFASGLFGSVQPFGLAAIVYSTQQIVDKVLGAEPIAPHKATFKRVVECELFIDPMQMKSIHQWLGTKITEYEKMFGKIPSPEEIESRSRRAPGQ